MNNGLINLLLADDDMDDCLLFKEALSELPFQVNIKAVNDGEQLIRYLSTSKQLPDVLFLDLNMPCKNGFECLSEIQLNSKYKNLPVIIISTSFDHDIVKLLYNSGAMHYICKPSEYSKLKRSIQLALLSINQEKKIKPSFENFVLQP